METQQIVETVLETVRQEVLDSAKTHKQIRSSKEYEERLLEIDRLFTLGLLREYIGKLPKSRNEQAKYAKQKAIDYYIEHVDRMQYKTCRNKGLLIGSVPVEAAHRSVIHQRMKL